MSVRRTVMFHLLWADPEAADAIAVNASLHLDEHAIVHDWKRLASGKRVDIRVEFASEAEIEGLVKIAHNAALHVASCDVEVAVKGLGR